MTTLLVLDFADGLLYNILMPHTLAFGQNMKSSGNFYVRVKEKGDQIIFRIAQAPAYSGKHFQQKEQGWDVTDCPRINNETECETCETYFQLMGEAKKIKDVDKTKYEKTVGEARRFNVAVAFYFPVLNRDTEEFAILQTTQGVRNKINEFHENGTKVFERDWILRNTGAVGKDRYSVAPVDSADSDPLTDKEKVELKKAQDFDIQSINEGGVNQDELEE